MTTAEFSTEFDRLYDNLSKGLTGLNEYEKSLFLTHAQEEIIKSRYSLPGFESNEKIRRELVAVSKPYASSVFTEDQTHGLDANSKFFSIPLDAWYLFFEEAKLYAPNTCFHNKYVGVKPITHDEYNLSKNNPFRKPNKRKAWRVDIQLTGGAKVVEIISEYEPTMYRMRYVEKPTPIILTDFSTDPDLTGMNLTIDGKSTTTECALSSELHRDILKRAVNLAIASYRETNLATKIELDKLNV